MAKAKYSYNEKRKEWIALVFDGTFTDSGQKHRKRITSKKSSADLEKKVNEFKRQVEEQGASRACPYTFGEYARLWLDTAKATKEENTKRMYDIVLKSSFNGINHLPLTELTHTHFQQLINEKADHPRMCQQISLTFKQIIKSAIRDRYLPRTAEEDILTDISLPKHQKPLKRALTESEKYALKAAELDDRKRAFVSILYYCGLRKGEALALTPNDFNWHNKTVSITKTWIGTPAIKSYPKSDNGIRVVPIPDAGINSIKPFVTSCKDRYLFHGRDMELMTETAYRRMWESIICSMNIALGYDPQQKNPKPQKTITDLTAHIFRHNYCTELCYQVPIISTKMIAKLLGDNEKMVLDVYSHLIEEKESTNDAINRTFDF